MSVASRSRWSSSTWAGDRVSSIRCGYNERRSLERGGAGDRLAREEALALASASSPDEVLRLGQAALANRQERFGDRATYVFNLSINPSNICRGGCRFCQYSARPHDEHAYTLDSETILGQIGEARPVEVHIVGGMNRTWDLERSLGLPPDQNE